MKNRKGTAMKFFKENSYDIVRLFINQIGITIFSFVLYTALQFDLDPGTTLTIRICLSVFATLFYLTLIYTAAWEFGSKDKLRVDSGRYNRQPAKGTLMSLIANIPNLVLAIVALVCFIIYSSAASEAAYSIFVIFNSLMRFLSAMYIGIIQGIFSFLPDNSKITWICETVAFAVSPVFAIGVTQLGYSLGHRDFRLASLFKAKNLPDSNNK